MSTTFERHMICGTCGAYLQQVRFEGRPIWRCPWVKPASQHRITEDVIWCDRPIAERIVGGMSREAVRNV